MNEPKEARMKKGGNRGPYAPPAKQFTKEKWAKWLNRLNTEHLSPRVQERAAAIAAFRQEIA